MTRIVLPARRPSIVREFRFGPGIFTLTLGFGPSGLAEIFVTAPKAGSEVAAVARDAAISVSIALQHGADLDVLTRAMTRDEAGLPASLIGAALVATLEVVREVGQ